MRYQYRSSNAVWVIMGINTLMFIITGIRPDIGDFLAVSRPFQTAEWWTILTAMFVHANFSHILFNMLTFYFFATFCLMLVDTKWFLLVYFLGGIFGNILFLLLGPAFSSAVGASGAIFALGGLLAVMRPSQRVYLYFIIPLPLWVVIIFGFLLTAFSAEVAWQAHLGGLVVGLIAGFFFRRREHRRLKPGYYEWR